MADLTNHGRADLEFSDRAREFQRQVRYAYADVLTGTRYREMAEAVRGLGDNELFDREAARFDRLADEQFANAEATLNG